MTSLEATDVFSHIVILFVILVQITCKILNEASITLLF